MLKRLPLSLLYLAFFLLLAAPALTQSGDGVQPEATAQPADRPPATGVVTGNVVNGTADGQVPESGEPMLHLWDSTGQEKGMEHGELLPDGTFRFENVPFVPGWRYASMLNYQDVTYFSEAGQVEAGQTELALPVTVYEATTATDAVRVAQQHVFFDAAAEGQVMVGEIYILSNSSDRTVALPAGAVAEMAPLGFTLPDRAQDINVENNRDGRFKPTEAGFVDTAPLRPGGGTGQVVVRYTLPYEDALTYTLRTPWPVDALNLLVPAGSGLTGLPPGETMQMGNSAEVAVFDVGPLKPGETLSLQLTGNLTAPPAAPATSEPATPAATGSPVPPLASVAIVLGSLLLVLAVWFYRRPAVDGDADGDVEPADSFEGLVTEIALLDEAHEKGQIDEQDYTRRRSLLFAQAQQLRPEG